MSEKPEPRRRGRPSRDAPPKREDILRTALAAFGRGGFDGTSLREIAREAHVDVALIAHHFGSKLDLWKATVDALSAHLLDVTRQTVAAGSQKSIREGVRAALRAHIKINSELPELALFVAHEVVPSSERSDYVYERLVKPHHDVLVPLIRHAISAGVIRRQDSDMLFFTLVTSVAMCIAIQPMISRFSPRAARVESFRKALEETVLANLLVG